MESLPSGESVVYYHIVEKYRSFFYVHYADGYSLRVTTSNTLDILGHTQATTQNLGKGVFEALLFFSVTVTFF